MNKPLTKVINVTLISILALTVVACSDSGVTARTVDSPALTVSPPGTETPSTETDLTPEPVTVDTPSTETDLTPEPVTVDTPSIETDLTPEPVTVDTPAPPMSPPDTDTPSSEPELISGSVDENEFYSGFPTPNSITVAGLTGADSFEDSQAVNLAIDNMHNIGGGFVIISKVEGEPYIYLRDIIMRSNVHLKIMPDVIIRPFKGIDELGRGRPGNIVIIDFGRTSSIENVAVTAFDEDSTDADDWFKVELTGKPDGELDRLRFIDAISVRNFKISGLSIEDNNSVFSNLEFNINPQSESVLPGDIPTDGVVKNIQSTNNHVGYGITQMRAGKNILFRNLDGDGGITLRLESGFAFGISSAIATIDNVVGREITVRNGDAAVVLSPHRVNQGVVDVRGIRSFNSTYAVQIAAGFLDNKGDVDNVGIFSENSVIADIEVVAGGDSAQVKSKDFKLYPCSAQTTLNATEHNQPDGESTVGPSLAVVRHGADVTHSCNSNPNSRQGCYNINLTLPDDAQVSNTLLDRQIVYIAEDSQQCP